ncbi:hypothetical protein C0Q70_04256 [Pomacea canaliculata]|uniref:Uncharacterized protein n=1 Tax=Pomacea canaliculata TaxID=400727 RepID=A0A2T7PV12_POMCA|nr:hypothetical protein C0Q70_04256 [Pomacea canaliculata]
MEQRLYGVNTATLHHYPTQHLPSAYPGHQSFQNPRHPHFPSMYPPRQGFSGGLAYGGQQDWTFSGAASAGLGPLGGMNTGLHGGAACGVFGARPESGDYLYPSQGAGSGPSMQLAGPMSHPRALVSGGTQYCDSSVYPSSYSPDHCHPYPPSPSQSLSSSPSSTDSSDKLARCRKQKKKVLDAFSPTRIPRQTVAAMMKCADLSSHLASPEGGAIFRRSCHLRWPRIDVQHVWSCERHPLIAVRVAQVIGAGDARHVRADACARRCDPGRSTSVSLRAQDRRARVDSPRHACRSAARQCRDATANRA